MSRFRVAAARSLFWLLLLSLAGCAGGPDYAGIAGTLPPIPPGEARIYLYYGRGSYTNFTWTTVSFNGQAVGASGPGTVFFRDVPAGVYRVTAHTFDTDPDQARTITAKPGERFYIRVIPMPRDVNSEVTVYDDFALRVVMPQIGEQAIAHLQYTKG